MHHSDSQPEIKPVPIPLPLPFPPATKWRALVDDSVADAQRHVDRSWPFDGAAAELAFARAQALIPILRFAGEMIQLIEGKTRRQLPAVPAGHFVALSGDVVRRPTPMDIIEIFSGWAGGRWIAVEVAEAMPSDGMRPYFFWAGNVIFTTRDHGRRWRWAGEQGGGR